MVAGMPVFAQTPAIGQANGVGQAPLPGSNQSAGGGHGNTAVTAARKFYPLGYVPPTSNFSRPDGDLQQEAGTLRFYPPGYAMRRQSEQQGIRATQGKIAGMNVPTASNSPVTPVTAHAYASNDSPFIRVGLALNISSANVVALDDLEIKNSVTGNSSGVLPAASSWLVSAEGRQLKFDLLDSGMGLQLAAASTKPPSRVRDTALTPMTASVAPESFVLPLDMQANSGYTLFSRIHDGLFGLNGKAYRGALWLRTNSAGTFSTINFLNIEDYLLSVVPSEMPSNWPLEALKAQAVAARSYALANAGKHGSQGYDVKANTEDQMYTGVLAETTSGNQAVAQTAGIVIKNQGKIVPAYYHSTSGGSTESADYVWGKSCPFLQEVIDYDDASPKFTWTKKMPTVELEQSLRNRRNDIGSLQNIEIPARSPSNHNLKVLVTGTAGSVTLPGDEARSVFNLPSSNFNVMVDSQFCIFSGRGFGHRMGLSQWGAKALAEHGYNAAQILSYYYKDVSLDYP